jgi:hypothetical protein
MFLASHSADARYRATERAQNTQFSVIQIDDCPASAGMCGRGVRRDHALIRPPGQFVLGGPGQGARGSRRYRSARRLVPRARPAGRRSACSTGCLGTPLEGWPGRAARRDRPRRGIGPGRRCRMSVASRADHPVLRPGGHLPSRMGISAISAAKSDARLSGAQQAVGRRGVSHAPCRRWLACGASSGTGCLPGSPTAPAGWIALVSCMTVPAPVAPGSLPARRRGGAGPALTP